MKYKYRRGMISTFLAIALVVSIVWGYNQNRMKTYYKTQLNNEYQRLFYDMKDNVETVQTSLSKALLSKSKEKNILLLSQIWQQAYFAHDKLAQMPISHHDMSKTEKFLTQVSDYCYALIQNSLEGKEIDSKQTQALFKLQDYTAYLSKELENIHQELLKGDVNYSLVRRREESKFDKANENMLNTKLNKYEEEQMTEYPELIYDGPFSDQVLNVKPRGLGKKEVSEEKAKENAVKFLGKEKVDKITTFKVGKDSKDADIQAYTFGIEPKNKEKEVGIYIGVSKKGGKIIWMENPRNITNKKLTVKEAQKYADEFLKEKGYKSMEPNYSLKYANSVLFNYAYKQGDVTIYTDLIKVKVALDNGEIVGYDASKYLKSHFERDIPKPNLTQEEARDKVKYDFDISNVRLAMIPDRGNNDVLCYEFRGKYKGFDFIVYINAENGREEEILKIIKDEDGVLMI